MIFIYIILEFISFLLLTSSRWSLDYFGLSCFEQIIFHLKVPLEGTNTQFLKDWFFKCGLKSVFLTVGEALLLFGLSLLIGSYNSLILIASGLNLLLAIYFVGIFGFIKNLFSKTVLYENHYVAPREVALDFPKKEKNLIHIYVESLETTYASKELGGNYDYNLLEPLTSIPNTIAFSHNEKLGGAHMVAGTGWTTAGIIAQSSGIPLFSTLTQKPYRDGVPFYSGVYGIGDILSTQGYQQMYMIGSDALFGGRKFYFKQHGNFEIYDLKMAYKKEKLEEGYKEFWGYDDEKLFSYAKEEIVRLSKDGLFNFTMLTVDSHHPYGYVCDNCKDDYPEQLSNVIACDMRQLRAFIDWIQKQDFYKDTVIVVSGDHLSMAQEYIHKTYDKNYERTIFNMFINSDLSGKYTKNRVFTSFDMYPTIVSALGIKIDGNRLGLGTNLDSSEKTVAEQIGIQAFDKELRKQSAYYKKNIMKL